MTKQHEPKIVLLDIETSPILGYTWQMWDARVLGTERETKVISVAWKFLGERKVHVVALNDFKGYKPGEIDDYGVVKTIWDVLDQASIVVAHNGNAFDIKKLNARFAAHGLNAPAVYKTIDTLKVAKKYFKFDSNKLDSLSQSLGLGSKIQTGGFDLWMRCVAGDVAAWNKMKRYNKHDVVLLEQIYLKLRPFMTDHPNVNLIQQTVDHSLVCPVCLSHDIVRRGFGFTKTGKRQQYKCRNCGSWSYGPYTKSDIILR
jgi:hypothetical protein